VQWIRVSSSGTLSRSFPSFSTIISMVVEIAPSAEPAYLQSHQLIPSRLLLRSSWRAFRQRLALKGTVNRPMKSTGPGQRSVLVSLICVTSSTNITAQLPPPREPTPEPNVSSAHDFVRPCRHCHPDNEYGWNCPIPIADPRTDHENAWPIDRGCPPGHAWCGNW
jgi:E3 ubiquitin-protein ligase CHFR